MEKIDNTQIINTTGELLQLTGAPFLLAAPFDGYIHVYYNTGLTFNDGYTNGVSCHIDGEHFLVIPDAKKPAPIPPEGTAILSGTPVEYSALDCYFKLKTDEGQIFTIHLAGDALKHFRLNLRIGDRLEFIANIVSEGALCKLVISELDDILIHTRTEYEEVTVDLRN